MPDSAAPRSADGPGGPHRTTLLIDGTPVETLADIPPLRDRLLFVGLNPSPVSVAAGRYHQGTIGRRFWHRLGEAGVIPPDTAPEIGDEALIAAGHGITDLLKRPTARDVASAGELAAGLDALRMHVFTWRPAAIVFVYKRVAETVAGRRLDARWGQLRGVAIAARPTFLMPAPYAPRAEVVDGLAAIRELVRALPQR